jgi:hypothetical protein
MGARVYDPMTGQFTSADPLGLGGGDTNLRRYAGNNPVNAIDPSGLKCTPEQKKALQDEIAKLDAEIRNIDIAAERLKQINTYHTGSFNYDGTNFTFDTGLKARVPGLPRSRRSLNNPTVPDNPLAYPGPLYQRKQQDQARRSQLQGQIDNDCPPPPKPIVFPGTCQVKPKPKLRALAGTFQPFADSGEGPDCSSSNTDSQIPGDPNNLIGPAGYGAGNFVLPQQVFPYTVNFENDPRIASAPAQDVTVTETLDSNLDWTTFQLGAIRFGSTMVSVPDGLQSYQTSVDTTNADGTPLRVDISAALDLQSGVLTWTFHSVDPATGLLPAAVDAGFLPVDDSNGRGEASVTYTVGPKTSLATGTPINAQATVVFDTNAPLSTATYTNTIDAGAPTSTVQALPAVSPGTFSVSWSGQDDANGSGIASYDVYVSANGGIPTLWQSATTQTSAAYTGQDGHTYAFLSVARDNVGHVQPMPASAQASTRVDAVPPTSSVQPLAAVLVSDVNPQSFAVNWSGSDNAGGSGIASYDVYVSVDGGAFTRWQRGTTQTSATYTGTLGHTYGYYSVATDKVGNRQATPSGAQARITIQPENPPPVLPRAIAARLITVKVGKKKKLAIEVLFADTMTRKKQFLSPFQKPAFAKIQVKVRDSNGDGVPDEVVLTAQKGKRTVTRTFAG